MQDKLQIGILRIGTTLYGYCGGGFGRDSYGNKRVEAIGADWVVARGLDSGVAYFFEGTPEELLEYIELPEDYGG